MRLTNNLRDAFVRAVMGDVPVIDYDEQARKQTQSAMDTFWISEVGTLDIRDRAAKRDVLERRRYCAPSPLQTLTGYGPAGYRWLETLPALQEVLIELAKLKRAQDLKVGELEAKIQGVAYSVTTRKALVAALPEFEKYLPPEDAATSRMTPVVQNVVADFVKAGWPKDRKGVAA